MKPKAGSKVSGHIKEGTWWRFLPLHGVGGKKGRQRVTRDVEEEIAAGFNRSMRVWLFPR